VLRRIRDALVNERRIQAARPRMPAPPCDGCRMPARREPCRRPALRERRACRAPAVGEAHALGCLAARRPAVRGVRAGMVGTTFQRRTLSSPSSMSTR
jgi:hypothetical protein